MRVLATTTMTALLIGLATAGDDPAQRSVIKVQKVGGDAHVRKGVTEAWTSVRVGDVLRPDDTFKTGANGTAVIVVNKQGSGGKLIALPPEVIVDMSDVRELTQEELMLKLTMEKVRSSPSEPNVNGLSAPRADVVHGTDRNASSVLPEDDLQTGRFQLNGTKVLFDAGFYSTCALRGLDVLRRYPQLGEKFEHKLLIAEALEKADLRGEALNAFVELGARRDLNASQRSVVNERISSLRKQSGQ